MAQNWCLPNELAEPLTTHHLIESNSSTMAKILYCVDWIDAVFNVTNINQTIQKCRELLDQLLDIDEDQLQEIFVALPEPMRWV